MRHARFVTASKSIRGQRAVTDQDQQRREIYYRGTVQGVGFRYTVRRIAGQFKVSGFVRNEPDGRVLLVVEGTRRQVDRFVEKIQGELGHYIAEADETVGPAAGEFHSFKIRF